MKFEFKKNVFVVVDFEIGQSVMINGFGPNLKGKHVIEDLKLHPGCESAVMGKVKGYHSYIDVGWFTKIPDAELSLEESWKGKEPAPIEFLHGRISDLFHEWRIEKFGKEQISPPMTGIDLNNIFVKAKNETYKKYEKMNLKQTIPSSDLL